MGTTEIARYASTLTAKPHSTLSKWHYDAIQEARRHARAMIRRLVDLANNAESEAVQRQAAADVLDRALGKAHQSLSLEGAAPKLQILIIDATASSDAPSVGASDSAVSIALPNAEVPDLP